MNIICIFAMVEGFLILKHKCLEFKLLVVSYLTEKCMRNSTLWCNGSTTDFGSVRVGSNPARVTKDFR